MSFQCKVRVDPWNAVTQCLQMSQTFPAWHHAVPLCPSGLNHLSRSKNVKNGSANWSRDPLLSAITFLDILGVCIHAYPSFSTLNARVFDDCVQAEQWWTNVLSIGFLMASCCADPHGQHGSAQDASRCRWKLGCSSGSCCSEKHQDHEAAVQTARVQPRPSDGADKFWQIEQDESLIISIFQ